MPPAKYILMNKNALVTLLVVGTVTAILIGGPSCTNEANAATLQQRQACANKYLPQNTTQYDICIGGMKSG